MKTATVKKPRSMKESLIREMKKAKAEHKARKGQCDGCQQLVQLLSQAVADNVQLHGQFETLRRTLADMEQARGTSRVWMS